MTAGSIDGPFGTAQERIDAVDLQPQVERIVASHDEHARGHAADRELLVALDLHPLDLDLLDLRGRRSLAQERHQLRDRLLRTLGVDGTSPSSPLRTQPWTPSSARSAHGRVAEADALHPAAHGGADRRYAARSWQKVCRTRTRQVVSGETGVALTTHFSACRR